jgi:hypothetical protein
MADDKIYYAFLRIRSKAANSVIMSPVPNVMERSGESASCKSEERRQR